MADEIAEIQPDAGKQATLFFVDAADYMMNPGRLSSEGPSKFVLALKAIRKQLSDICCAADKRQKVGIIFFNTALHQNENGYDNIWIYREVIAYDDRGFEVGLDAEFVKDVDGVIADPTELRQSFGGDGLCDYLDVLRLAESIFNYKTKFQRRVAAVFTSNEFLAEYDDVKLASVEHDIGRFRALGFGLKHFVIGSEPLADHWNRVDPHVKLFDSADDLAVTLKRRNIAMRPSTTLRLDFGKGVNLAVGVYNLIAEQRRETGVYLHEDTNEVVKLKTRCVTFEKNDASETEGRRPAALSATSQLLADEGLAEDAEPPKKKFVDPKLVPRVRVLGGEQLELHREELNKFHRIEAPGITIIGFKPMSCLKASHHMGTSLYIYPNDESIHGSAVMYRALYECCTTRDLFVLARMVTKAHTNMRMVALVPQRSALDDDDPEATAVENYFYEGFHVVALPFADDKRDLSEKLNERDILDASADQVEAAEAFVRRLTAPFSPDNFCNPVLQKHYWYLEGAATGYDPYDGKEHDFDDIKPYFESSATRGHAEARGFNQKL